MIAFYRESLLCVPQGTQGEEKETAFTDLAEAPREMEKNYKL